MTTSIKHLAIFLIVAIATTVNAFAPVAVVTRQKHTALEATSRRSILQTTAAVTLLAPQIALASGGATVGGPYLISAKQHYNDRVKASLKAYLALGKSLESGSTEEAKAYFMSEEPTGWKDGSVAAYLLANAFRRNSSAAPDTLPAVKKWKAFAAAVETVMKATKKKDPTKVVTAYTNSLELLDIYLEEVELPPSKEL